VLGEKDASVVVVKFKHGDLLLPFRVVAVSELFTSVHGGTMRSAELEAGSTCKATEYTRWNWKPRTKAIGKVDDGA